MSLRVYNTLGKKIEEFKPLSGMKVGFYGCGPTVYNYAHIGNLRAYVFQDILTRTLSFLGYDVTHVMNITDVGHLSGDNDEGEDKMVKSAKERGKSVMQIADYYTKAFFTDTERLNILKPTIVCKATDHIPEMIALIKRLEERGHTYFSEGNLYYDISTFPDYGKMAGFTLDELKAGARVAIDKNKKNPHDFVLWFTQSKFENQALVWDSPWGKGYPGWHIECSAMSMKYLGEQFEIHSGGIDHIRIHHTNEIAQSEGATGKPWVKYWMHNEFLVMNKGKMSKSSGEFITLQAVIDKGFDPIDYRFLLLGGHYRSQLTFSWEAMETAKNARKSLQQRIENLKSGIENLSLIEEKISASDAEKLLRNSPALPYFESFVQALEDDLSTPRAISEMQQLIKDKTIYAEDRLKTLSIFDQIFGLNLFEKSKSNSNKQESAMDEQSILTLIQERTDAKNAKNYQRADEIRDELRTKGIILEDTPKGTVWKRI
ncbi:cysteine--tRNA ligase [Treponema phagedenis]|uniref:cysteine--tRNA ligase n=1 Tax=Treponema phagedenis TaxID=162 RepID=UPI0001F6425C|nr:cysteine--tRNA ligase [Treponema phagedenis]EFW39178.1 cysteine--tRNA ligase [Treponema phagedenis F0421]TYT78382.1 cysteine--tRNA ligase [Treponema phagedenis]